MMEVADVGVRHQVHRGLRVLIHQPGALVPVLMAPDSEIYTMTRTQKPTDQLAQGE